VDNLHYIVDVSNNNYLICYERVGDSHYTFYTTILKSQASKFGWKQNALEAIKAYIDEKFEANKNIEDFTILPCED
jgi:hypothetical protein